MKTSDRLRIRKVGDDVTTIIRTHKDHLVHFGHEFNMPAVIYNWESIETEETLSAFDVIVEYFIVLFEILIKQINKSLHYETYIKAHNVYDVLPWKR